MTRPRRAPKRVIMVGTDLGRLERASFPLISAGYEVLVLRYDDKTIDFIHAHHPDLVVLDNIGSWTTVLRLLTAFRGDFTLYQMAAVIVTEEDEATAHASWLRHHHYEVLKGPVNPPQITEFVRHILERDSTVPTRARA